MILAGKGLISNTNSSSSDNYLLCDAADDTVIRTSDVVLVVNACYCRTVVLLPDISPNPKPKLNQQSQTGQAFERSGLEAFVAACRTTSGPAVLQMFGAGSGLKAYIQLESKSKVRHSRFRV